MSRKKNEEEARRWFVTGQDYLDAALILRQNHKHAHSCFHAQQAVEKAIRGLWYFFDEEPWGHSIIRLIQDLKDIDEKVFSRLKKFINDAKKLDRYYIFTRYPSGLPDITPDVAYCEDDSQYCIDTAQKILKNVEDIIEFHS